MIKKANPSSYGRTQKNIAILGSTGSIGLNTLQIVRCHPERFRVKGLAACRNEKLLFKQAVEFRPEVVCLYDASAALSLSKKLKRYKIRVVSGNSGLQEVATLASVRQVVCAMVGAAGLAPIFAAVKAGKDLGIANKEPLVVAGRLLLGLAQKRKVSIVPIDSEHSGLWQCLEGKAPASIKKLILTSSGGPFRTWKGSLKNITPDVALKHPKWKMGPKITIDSATLMNKGLEVIEAANLFNVNVDHIEVVIHPEAIVHALVEFVDGSHLAQLGVTDMRPAIQYSLSYPERLHNHLPTLNLTQLGTLRFEKPNLRKFPALELGYEASRAGGSMPAALNAANEEAVEAFLNRRIRFLDIPRMIEKVMTRHRVVSKPTLRDLLETDLWAREAMLIEVSKKRGNFS